jgi:hypothetical protein
LRRPLEEQEILKIERSAQDVSAYTEELTPVLQHIPGRVKRRVIEVREWTVSPFVVFDE